MVHGVVAGGERGCWGKKSVGGRGEGGSGCKRSGCGGGDGFGEGVAVGEAVVGNEGGKGWPRLERSPGLAGFIVVPQREPCFNIKYFFDIW